MSQPEANAGQAPGLPPPILTLPRCILRHHHPSDVPAVQRAADSPSVARYMSHRFPTPFTLEDARRWVGVALTLKLDAADGTDTLTSLAISGPGDGEDETAATSGYLGAVGIKPAPRDPDLEPHTFEVAFWLAERAWGRGIMTEALAGYARWVFATFPQVRRLEAGVFDGNAASARVLGKAGFAHEGTRRRAAEKDGVVYDVLIFGLLREECVGAD